MNKPYYIHNPVTNTFDDVNAKDPIVDQVIKYSPKKVEPKKDEKLFENIIDNLGKPKDDLRKPRAETASERIERLHHMYDGGPKPKHYEDKKIVSWEKRNELKAKIKRPKPFDNNDPSTYPSNQKKEMNTWEIMMELAKDPKSRTDRQHAKEVRQTIYANWNKPSQRKYLGDDELKLIGKHKSQRMPLEVKPMAPAVVPIAKPAVPEIPLEERIRINSENRRQNEIRNLEATYGSGGIMKVVKDYI